MRYAVVYEKTDTGYSAYVPDLPGCVAAGSTRSDVERLIREAIAMHLDSMRNDGDPIPQPVTSVSHVEI
jgi:predicted RNase H-like HicB family nuclease